MGKMQAYIERLMQSRFEVTEDASRKRALPIEPTDGLDNAKRARLDAMTPPLLKIPPLPPGPTSYDQLFTLTQDIGLSSFDVKQLPPRPSGENCGPAASSSKPVDAYSSCRCKSVLENRWRERKLIFSLGYKKPI